MGHGQMRVRTIDLGYEQMMLFDSGPGTRVRVLHGATWLSEEGVEQDRVLRAGSEVVLRTHGATLLEGLSTARIEIRDSGGASRAAAALRALARSIRRLRTRLQFGPTACPDGSC